MIFVKNLSLVSFYLKPYYSSVIQAYSNVLTTFNFYLNYGYLNEISIKNKSYFSAITGVNLDQA